MSFLSSPQSKRQSKLAITHIPPVVYKGSPQAWFPLAQKRHTASHILQSNLEVEESTENWPRSQRAVFFQAMFCPISPGRFATFYHRWELSRGLSEAVEVKEMSSSSWSLILTLKGWLLPKLTGLDPFVKGQKETPGRCMRAREAKERQNRKRRVAPNETTLQKKWDGQNTCFTINTMGRGVQN